MSLTFKRNYPIIIILVVAVLFFGLVMGGERVVAYTSQSSSTPTQANVDTAVNITNDTALFDESVVHRIQIIIADEDYDLMVATYQQTGLKEYFKADILIDGVWVNDVGIRLKGNASLRTAIGGGGGFGGMFNGNRDNGNGENGQRQAMPGFNQNGERPQPPEGFEAPTDGQVPEGMNPGQDQPGAMPGGFARATDPDGTANVPFLVKFDEYVDGQTYQGYRFLSIRNYGTSYDAAMLQEPVTNDMVNLAGIPATETAYAGFQINDETEQLYVISEIIDEVYLAKHFDNADGVLYKAELGSTLAYQGEDPSAYADSFSQETRENEADLAPLIAFMRFLDQADDAEFETELPNWLDVDAFATYLAANNLLVNTDSMIGMNNNYYLYWDDAAERFTLLMWDANESLGKLGGSATYDININATAGVAGGMGAFGGRGGGMGGSNTLLTRFMSNTTFKALYLEKVAEVYQLVYASNAALADVEKYAELIQSVNGEMNLVDLAAYNAAAEKTRTFLSERAEYLSQTDLLSQ